MAAAQAEPAPTIPAWRTRVAVVALLGAAVSVGLSAQLGLRARPAATYAVLTVGGALAGLVATYFAAFRGRSMVGRARETLAAVTWTAPLSVLLFASFGRLAQEGGEVPWLGGTTKQHVVCFVCTLLFALGPLVALGYARFRSDPVHPRALGAALGAAAGVWGGALIDIHCSLVTLEHLAIGHAAPIAALALLGALVGSRTFGIRARN
jgi:hypothetical protein